MGTFYRVPTFLSLGGWLSKDCSKSMRSISDILPVQRVLLPGSPSLFRPARITQRGVTTLRLTPVHIRHAVSLYVMQQTT